MKVASPADRLGGPDSPFDSGVIERAAAVSEQLHNLSPDQIYRTLGFQDPDIREYEGYNPVEFLRVEPPGGARDPNYAVVVYQPMAAPLDNLAKLRLAFLAAALPGVRLVTVGNPSGERHSYGLLTQPQRIQIAQGDFRPFIQPMLWFLDEEKITRAAHLGYSFGAARAAATAAYAAFTGHHGVELVSVIEPTNIRNRELLGGIGLAMYGIEFLQSLSHIEPYRQHMPQAMHDATEVTLREGLRYLFGVARLTGLATALGLMHEGFECDAYTALASSAGRLAVAGATKSELVRMPDIYRIAGNLSAEFPGRVRLTVLEGDRHALAFDLARMLAVYLQGMLPADPLSAEQLAAPLAQAR